MNNLLNNINGWVGNGPYGNDLMATTASYDADDFHRSSSELAEFIPEIWGDYIRASFKQALKLGVLANDYSSLVSGGGDKIHIPSLADVRDAQSLTQGVAVEYQSFQNEEFTIDVNQHFYTSSMITDIAKVQANADLMGGIADSMAYKLALHMETTLESKLAGTLNGINITANTETKTLDQKAMGTIISELYKRNVEPSDCMLILGNTLYASLFQIDDFIHKSKADVANFSNGVAGTLMGIPVMQCAQVSGTTAVHGDATDQTGTDIDDTAAIGGYVVHKDALGIAYSKQPTPVAEYDMDYVAHKMVTDVVYGCGLLQNSDQKKCWALYEDTVTAF